MAKNMRTSWFVAMAMLAPAFCGQVAWGNPGLIDDFNDTNLSEYTASYILEQDASNTITFASPSPSGVLQATKVDPGGTNPNCFLSWRFKNPPSSQILHFVQDGHNVQKVLMKWGLSCFVEKECGYYC